jgi:hypothetical protein
MRMPRDVKEQRAEDHMRSLVEHAVRNAVSRFYDQCGYTPLSITADIQSIAPEELPTFARIRADITIQWCPVD